jgi:DNA-binding NtrC family response regulator
MKTEQWLVSWVGQHDLDCSTGTKPDKGPILEALDPKKAHYDRLLLLCNYPFEKGLRYREWLLQKTQFASRAVELVEIKLTSPIGPIDYDEIYEAVIQVFESRGWFKAAPDLTFHLSPGTSAMAAIWLILAKGRMPAKLIQTQMGKGPMPVVFKGESVTRTFLPYYLNGVKAAIARELDEPERTGPRVAANPRPSPLLNHSDETDTLLRQAERLAKFEVPVLLHGEAGHPYEALARRIHELGSPHKAPFRVVNGASLGLEGALLSPPGRGRGRGAAQGPARLFEQAAGGTLFIQDVEQLSPEAQAALLQCLASSTAGDAAPGAETPSRPATRVVASTQADLGQLVRDKKFRGDLLRRLAVGVLRFTPLQQRPTDVAALIDAHLQHLSQAFKHQVTLANLQLSREARGKLLSYAWPSNEEQLEHVMLRAVLCAEQEITAKNIEDALCLEGLLREPVQEDILNRPLDDQFSLPQLLAEVELHYIDRALKASNNNKTQAAKKLGLNSHQSLGNRKGAAQRVVGGAERAS